jgi:hypothetical protein
MFVRYVVRGFDGLSLKDTLTGARYVVLGFDGLTGCLLKDTLTGTTMNYFSSLLKKKWNDARSWNFLKQDVSQQD